MSEQEPAAKPWDPLPNEPKRWYRCFEIYRLMGVNRTLAAAYQSFWLQKASQSYGESPTSRPKHVSGGWRKHAEEFHWRERAESWDDWCVDEARRLDAERRSLILKSGYARKEARIALLNQMAALLGGDPGIRINKELGGAATTISSTTGVIDTADAGGEVFEKEKRWVPDVKMIGSGFVAERVDIVRFNGEIINQLRGLLSDLAAEVGDRKVQSQNTNLDLDIATLTDEQLERIANGADPLNVLANPGTGGD